MATVFNITPDNYDQAPPRMVGGVAKPALYRLGDGLLLQVTPGKNGSVARSWAYRYSIAGHERRMGIGSTSKLSYEAAKIEVAILARQKDPLADRERQQREEKRQLERPPEITFAEAAAQYAADKIQPRSGEAYAKKWLRIFAIHAPELSAMLVGEVDRTAVKRALKPLWDSKHTKTGKDLRGRIEQVLTWAIAEGHRDEDAGNPATWKGNLEATFATPHEVRPIKPQAALKYKHAGAFMAELRSKDWLGARATEFAILTVSRANEVIGMRRQEVDWSAAGRCGRSRLSA